MTRIAMIFALMLGAMLTSSAIAQDAADMPETVVDTAVGNDDFSILVQALQAAGFVETLQGEGPFTVFAPTNAAFEALLAELGITAEELLARHDLAAILTYHVVPDNLLAADVVAAVEGADGEAAVETVNGAPITVTTEMGNVYLNDSGQVVTTDLQAGNGVVHVIDSVLLPSSDGGM